MMDTKAPTYYACLRYQSQECSIELLDPDGQQLTFDIEAANAGAVWPGKPILRSGTYKIRILPRTTPTSSMSC